MYELIHLTTGLISDMHSTIYLSLIHKCVSHIIERTHRDILFCILLNQTNFDCHYHFPIDLEPNEISFGSKSIRIYRNYNPNSV